MEIWELRRKKYQDYLKDNAVIYRVSTDFNWNELNKTLTKSSPYKRGMIIEGDPKPFHLYDGNEPVEEYGLCVFGYSETDDGILSMVTIPKSKVEVIGNITDNKEMFKIIKC